ncbi:MAG: GAF domain-containing protein [Cyclobacteriaceae bacterium]|nr:GAF domain-containing protein [Cyclobacteriaceae bacterium]
MMQLFKDQLRISYFFAALFLIGILVTVISLYQIPSVLYLTDGFARLTTTYFTVALTLLAGIVALIFALAYRKELIVIRERTVTAETERTSESSQTTYNTNQVHAALKDVKSRNDLFHKGLQIIGKTLQIGQGAIYEIVEKGDQKTVNFVDGYAFTPEEGKIIQFDLGDGLIGQVAVDGKIINLDEIPEGYINIISGLGSSSPRYLLIVPIKSENNVLGVMELASFSTFDNAKQKFAEQATQVLSEKLSTKI